MFVVSIKLEDWNEKCWIHVIQQMFLCDLFKIRLNKPTNVMADFFFLWAVPSFLSKRCITSVTNQLNSGICCTCFTVHMKHLSALTAVFLTSICYNATVLDCWWTHVIVPVFLSSKDFKKHRSLQEKFRMFKSFGQRMIVGHFCQSNSIAAFRKGRLNINS